LATHRQVQISSPPVGITAHRSLRCRHQEETQQRVSLFADVTQSPAKNMALVGALLMFLLLPHPWRMSLGIG